MTSFQIAVKYYDTTNTGLTIGSQVAAKLPPKSPPFFWQLPKSHCGESVISCLTV